MRVKLIFSYMLLGGLLAACSPHQQVVQPDPQWDETMPIFSPDAGFLRIDIAAREERVFADDPPDGKLRYEPYEIYTETGKKIRTVTTSFIGPHTISLTPGKYVVIVKMGRERFKKFGVIIESGKTTLVQDSLRKMVLQEMH